MEWASSKVFQTLAGRGAHSAETGFFIGVSYMKALLKFDNGARELRAEPEAKDKQAEIHDILLDRLERIANLKPDDKNFQNEIINARTVAELSEQVIKHGMYVVALNRLANNAAADVKLPKFLLG
jgi:hypothetical protein